VISGGDDQTQSEVSVLALAGIVVGGATVLALIAFGCVILLKFVTRKVRSGGDLLHVPLELGDGSDSVVDEVDLSLSDSRNLPPPPIPI
jgi:hypothetical protein